ncbi:hypothetical protein HYPSUDRAFT_208167 [Hypholoma sublateritium FD-334 SS-4]|uniref:CxC2-like cysteine cluster KDZ transposase-associated domain-containing protein n=1 Tax=Hypholoma sublateritium (strain FD-334 SS-4) TaxID=945553 RepID=A0A0D2NEL1_HYPSF|nr:hypothetical protein HYPSUDRAFT_208167 [Hypholoma sublateritium FD-334 SS-4]
MDTAAMSMTPTAMRVPLEDNFEVIHARTTHLTSRKEPIESSRSPLKGQMTRTLGNVWAPEDNEELALDKTDERYNEEIMVGLQWRHLKMLKRTGRAHDEAGIAARKDGELVVMCPSCPHPGINLPEGWDEVPKEQVFLYQLLLCMDANFRLKNQLMLKWSQDPGLGIGWAYMVRREPYEAYVLSKADNANISTCIGFQALTQALTRFSKGLQYTGVGGVFCGDTAAISLCM